MSIILILAAAWLAIKSHDKAVVFGLFKEAAQTPEDDPATKGMSRQEWECVGLGAAALCCAFIAGYLR